MADTVVVAGTDTDIGKTVFAAALTRALDGCYWKPVQSGIDDDGGTDTTRARRLSGLPEDRFFPEAYRLRAPLSPDRSAELDGVKLEEHRLGLPACERPLVVELAGGLLVPLNEHRLQIDVVSTWGAPVVLCARTSLGTINHTLLSVEALRRRDIPLLGLAFIGEANDATEASILRFSGARRLGRLPKLERLAPDAIGAAFARNFDVADFTGALA